jgi:hypothetical protein
MPAFVALAVGMIGLSYYFTSPLFYEECRNERNLLTGDLDRSVCTSAAEPLAIHSDQDGRPSPSPRAVPPDNGAAPYPAFPARSGALAQGRFVNGEPGHQGSGQAELQRLPDGSLILYLSEFAVTNGPDLVVILSDDAGGGKGSVAGGVSLGALKANNGNQNYAIPAATEVRRYASVIIYCKSFPTVFAYARLEASE